MSKEELKALKEQNKLIKDLVLGIKQVIEGKTKSFKWLFDFLLIINFFILIVNMFFEESKFWFNLFDSFLLWFFITYVDKVYNQFLFVYNEINSPFLYFLLPEKFVSQRFAVKRVLSKFKNLFNRFWLKVPWNNHSKFSLKYFCLFNNPLSHI